LAVWILTIDRDRQPEIEESRDVHIEIPRQDLSWVSCRPCCSNQGAWNSFRIQSRVSSHGPSVTGDEQRKGLCRLTEASIVVSGNLSLDLTDWTPAPLSSVCPIILLPLLILQCLYELSYWLFAFNETMPRSLMNDSKSGSFWCIPSGSIAGLSLLIYITGHIKMLSKKKACEGYVFILFCRDPERPIYMIGPC